MAALDEGNISRRKAAFQLPTPSIQHLKQGKITIIAGIVDFRSESLNQGQIA